MLFAANGACSALCTEHVCPNRQGWGWTSLTAFSRSALSRCWRSRLSRSSSVRSASNLARSDASSSSCLHKHGA